MTGLAEKAATVYSLAQPGDLGPVFQNREASLYFGLAYEEQDGVRSYVDSSEPPLLDGRNL
ncbi:MAG: hypothetical protein ACREP8_08440 [Candidatus Binatia bacterium]